MECRFFRIFRRKTVTITFGTFLLLLLVQIYVITDNSELKRQISFSRIGELRERFRASFNKHHATERLRDNSENLQKICKPINSRLFPFCIEKFQVLKNLWKTTCFKDVHKLDGTDCSVLRYLQEIEPYCPKDKQQIRDAEHGTHTANNQLKTRSDLEGLLSLLPSKDFSRMRGRIKDLWPQWMESIIKLKSENKLENSQTKKILIYLGAFAMNRWLLTGSNGIMGELVQWADTITAMYILGHDINIVMEDKEAKPFFQADEKGCASKFVNISQTQDLIFSDIAGFQGLQYTLVGNSNLARLRCKMRLLDSFGTEAEFNYAGYGEKFPGGESNHWGKLNLLLPQFLTYFPHSPDNTFLGFAASGNKPNLNKTLVRKDWAVIYGKSSNYLFGNLPVLNIIKEYFEIHATMMGEKSSFPPYVKNHGVLSIQGLHELLAQSKVFIGLGFPLEGPGPLDAISQGAVNINPKFPVPKNKLNDAFFGGKPTLRKVTSQNPYLEDFVEDPYSYTIDIRDKNQLVKVLKKIKQQKSFSPYLPREFTNVGFLEKLHTLIQKQNFCDEDLPRWPPLEKLQTLLGQKGQSCKTECHKRGLICEPTYFSDINSAETLKKLGIDCRKVSKVKKIHSPSYNTTDGHCFVQDHYLYFSCVAEIENLRRLCPCRTFIKGQTALC